MIPDFTIYPAVDLRKGEVVRLQQGDPHRQTVFGVDPVETAARWIDAGANWLHVVNLDGAFDEGGAANLQAAASVAGLGVPIQFGGGLRTLKDVAGAFNRGISRVVLGTAAVEDPNLVASLVRRFGSERIAVAIDARDGQVRTHGWQDNAHLSPGVLALQLRAQGVSRIIYTDISRDGLLGGLDCSGAAELARATGLRVIASGGVRSAADVHSALALRADGVEGLIIGRALYEGQLDLGEALRIAADKS